jgi:membrane-bound ClpP family serine protease
MTWIIILLIIGFVLMFFEVYFIPGTSFIGIIGGLSSIVAMVLIFRKYGNFAGFLSLLITVLAVSILIIVGSGNKVWQRMSNQNIISPKANMVEQDEIKPGLLGIAVTNIHPIGTGKFLDANYIVQTEGEKIVKGTQIEVIRVNVAKIIVKPANVNNA